jgi:hydroxymethylpyrimidine/phosphomethylpyrimidine kinase
MMHQNPPIPVALTIAGSDSGGGAGIQADLKTFAALGVYGCSAIASVTAQNTLGVQAVLSIPPDFLRAQIESVLQDIYVSAIKTGMLSSAGNIALVAQLLEKYPHISSVIDPVMIATSGHRLIDFDAMDALIKLLIPRASIITPNLHEAAELLSEPMAINLNEMEQQGKKLLALGAKAVLIKGGHGDHFIDADLQATDILVTQHSVEIFSAPRIATKNTHGTGCTLASAIAAGLAKQLPLNQAVKNAKDYLHQALMQADRLQIGHGAGPVHHFYKFY